MPARIPASLSRIVRKEPKHLLDGLIDTDNRTDVEQRALEEPIGQVPDSVAHLGPWLGRIGESVPEPECVVHGICQGKLGEEKNLWIELGPSVEAVYGLDLAYEVARQHSAELVLWIVDNEYRIYASSEGGDPGIELEVGSALEAFIRQRYDYDKLKVLRTSDATTRGEVYALVTDVEVQTVLGTRVHRPFGLDGRNVWLQLEFLGTMACLMSPAMRGKRTWAITDHHQIRPATLAGALAHQNLDSLFFWPLPGLDWKVARDEKGKALSCKPLLSRRMYASKTLTGKAFVLDDANSLEHRGSLSGQPGVEEVIDYLTHGSETAEADSLSLPDAIAIRRNRYANSV